jgi:anhydromevalonate phosphate decarboxylase
LNTDIRSLLSHLESQDELERIRDKVSPRFQVAHIMKKRDGGKALLFENVVGYRTQVLSGMCGTKYRLALTIDKTEDQLHSVVNDAISRPIEPRVTDDASVKEVVESPKLSSIPVLTHYEKDRGPYIASGIVSAKSSDGTIENVSIHRMLIMDDHHLTMRIVPRHLYALCRMAKEKGKTSLDIAIAIGLHPAVLVAAASPAPFGVSEYGVANVLMNSSLKLVEIGDSGLRVPADSELAFEAKMLLDRDVDEGPFVDLTGTYDIVRKQPLVEVTKVYHRREYIYQALLPGGSEHKILMGLPYEARIFQAVSGTVPKVKSVNLTSGGCGWLHAIVSIEKQTEGDGKNALMAAFGAHPSVKHVVIVDADIDVNNPQDIEWAIATRLQADKGLVMIQNARGSSLDPSANQEDGTTTKVGIDATRTLKKPIEKFAKARIPE